MATTKKATKTIKASATKIIAKGPGVIATIITTIHRTNGATIDEILTVLKSKFPDRDPDGMRKTIAIQASKNPKRKDINEKRGLICCGHK